nr:RPM1-interacting protein 4-like isoform X1 [Coffea arabica]
MAQRSHVPKFGNWDGENVPYTAYFDNARKEKISGIRMNPNDPEENPEAFMFSGLINGGEASEFSPTPLQRNLVRPISSEKYRQKQRYGHWRNTSDEPKSVGQKSPGSESITDKNNYDNPHQQKRSERKKSMMTENSNSFIPLSPARRARGGSDTSDDLSYNSASVPKFGAWDERDPRSGEGFTVIFNKVKEEKRIAASKFAPAQQPQSSNNAESHKRDAKSKVCNLFLQGNARNLDPARAFISL